MEPARTCCRIMVRLRRFRLNKLKDCTGQRSAVRALDKRDSEIRVSSKAQGETGSFMGRAVLVRGSGNEDPKVGKSR